MLRGKFKFNAVCHIFFIALSRQQNLQQNIAQCATDNQPQHSTASLECSVFCDSPVYSSPLSHWKPWSLRSIVMLFLEHAGEGVFAVGCCCLFVNLFLISSICRFSLRFFMVLQSIFVFFNHKLMLYQSNGCDPLICSSCCADPQPQNCFHCYVITAILQLL